MDAEVLISLRGVRIAYGAHTVLRDVSLDVCAGQVWVLTGRNGGGKTSLLRVMAGLLLPQAGEVCRCEGLRVGFLSQAGEMDRTFPITVSEVVKSGVRQGFFPSRKEREACEAKCAQAMERLALTSLADSPICALSGGQWQRTLLARAIVDRPRLLLLDEPETYLDSAARDGLYEMLNTLRADCSMVIVSHDSGIVRALPGAQVMEVGE